MEDYSIWETGAYQFIINNESYTPSPLDTKLRDTVFILIEAFFNVNPEILLYICETGDGKQEFRSRLFVRWFNTYSGREAYILETAEVKDGETNNFAALIVHKSLIPSFQKFYQNLTKLSVFSHISRIRFVLSQLY